MRVVAVSSSLIVFALLGCGGGSASDESSGGSPSMSGAGSANAGNAAAGSHSSAGSSASAGSDSAAGGRASGGASAGSGAVGGAQSHGGTSSAAGGPSGNVGNWQNATGNLANMASECGNLGLVSAQPGTNMVVAGVAKKGLWSTVDGGATWTALGTGVGSAVITNRISTIVWDPDHPGTFWESGIYNGGGVYKTTDNGVTFTQLGNATHNDSLSVDLGDPNRQTMLAGAHETERKLFLSTDGGSMWTDIGAALPVNSGYCTSTLVLDAMTFLVGCSGPASATGIYRSANAGGSWTRVGMRGVSPQPLLASSTDLYWADSQGGVQKSSDRGLTFTQVADGNTAPFVTAPTTLAHLPDGRIVTIGKDHLQASADGGKAWAALGDPLPFTGGGYDGAAGVTYSQTSKKFFIWRWTCADMVASNAIMSLAFDYETQ